jgi:NAD(P)-dependent dehydrogenase (short-subunit alcohol dehydrogenase family)
VVTGANSGIGLAAAKAFATADARVVLVGRDRSRLDDARGLVATLARGSDVRPAAYQADFARFDDVRTLAAALSDAYPSIDVLANNAGGSFGGRITTVDGFELSIQVNHLAGFLLSNLLRERLAGGRIINTASEAHRTGTLDPAHLNDSGRPVYGASKQANILFAAEAARRWPEISSFSYHPGLVRTRFGRHSIVVNTFIKVMPGLRTPTQGCDTMVWLAGAPLAELENGGYYHDRRRRTPSRAASDPAIASALWSASEAAVRI